MGDYSPMSYTPASYTTGGGGSFIDQMTRAESGGRADARPLDENGRPRTSAFGAHQFTSGTWLSVVRRFGGSRIAGLSEEQILALRADPVFSRQMAEAHTQFDLAPALQRSRWRSSDASAGQYANEPVAQRRRYRSKPLFAEFDGGPMA
jgi:hypothetical protein